MEMQKTVLSAMQMQNAKKEAEETSTGHMPRIRFGEGGNEVHRHDALTPRVPLPATASHTPNPDPNPTR